MQGGIGLERHVKSEGSFQVKSSVFRDVQMEKRRIHFQQGGKRFGTLCSEIIVRQVEDLEMRVQF